mgnify:FL=1
MTTYTICDTELTAPFDRPRFTGRAIVLAPYASGVEWDAHFAQTQGFGDPRGSRGDELRFGREDGRLKSLNLLVPEVPLAVFPENLAVESAEQCTLRGIARGRRNLCLSAERGLLCMADAPSVTSVQVAEHLCLFVDSRHDLCGWQLEQPEAALSTGYAPCPARVVDRALAAKLASYFALTHDADFVDRLINADDDALARVRALALDVARLGEQTSQQRALRAWVDELLTL